MKKILPLLLLVCGFANGQIVNIPDATFKATVLSSSSTVFIAKNLSGNFFDVDTNDDGEIQVSEAQQVSYLRLYDLPISNLTGIEAFTNLTHLQCWKLDLTTLDVSTLTDLELLNCSDNELSTLDISTLTELETLTCSKNNFTALDFTNNPNLIMVACEENQLTTVNVSNLNNLTQLSCGDNMITNITFPTNSSLTFLSCEENQLTALDFANLTNLEYLDCSINSFTSHAFNNLPALENLHCGGPSLLTSLSFGNLPSLDYLVVFGGSFTSVDFLNIPTLTTLFINSCNNVTEFDFSDLVNLEQFGCSHHDNITSLDLSHNVNLYSVSINNNIALEQINFKNGSLQNFPAMFFDSSLPSLQYVCGDDDELAILQNEVDTFYPAANIVVNSYCSFTPGGDYNTITGTVLFDANNNGCDANDSAQPFIKLKINDGTNEGTVFSNSNASYSLYTGSGNFTLTPEVENPALFNISPANAVVNFPLVNNATATQNFCITANGIHPDVEIVIAPLVPARPGFDAVYKIVYKNKGNQVLSGQLFFEYDEAVLDLVSSNPLQDNTLSGYLGYAYANLMPFENREITITLNVNGPMDTPAVDIDDELEFSASIILTSGTDANPSDNVFNFDQIVVGAYDPNDKQCIEGSVVDVDQVGGYLHYLIRFENTGNYYAENIVVKDILNTEQFDVSSLRVLNSSHPVTARIDENVAEFIFKNINLDSGGHGNILLKVKTLNHLDEGTTVANKADIFFDYNYPIETNVAQTTFQTLGIPDHNMDQSIAIYPNPATDFVTIKAANSLKTIELFDVQGRILMTRLSSQLSETIDLSRYNSGVYFIRIHSANGAKTEKLIKR